MLRSRLLTNKALLRIIFGVGFASMMFLALPNLSHAATDTWTNGAGTGQWSNPGNWSGNAVPASGDTVNFTASSTANCAIDINTQSLAGFNIQSNYTGTITVLGGNTLSMYDQFGGAFTQAGGTFVDAGSLSFSAQVGLTLNGGTFIQSSTVAINLTGNANILRESGGVFQGGTGAINVNGVQISGGTFISTAGTLTSPTFYFQNNGTGFNANNGTVSISPGGTFGIGSGMTPVFYNLTLGSGITIVNYGDATSTISGTFTSGVFGNFYNSFIVDGNVINTNTAYGSNSASYGSGHGLFFEGTSTQTYVGTSTPGVGSLGNVTVNNPGGTLIIQGGISISGNINIASGNINYGTSTFGFFPYSAAPYLATSYVGPASTTIPNVTFGSDSNSGLSIATGTVINVSNSFDYAGTTWGRIIGGGTINVNGNLIDTNTYYGHDDFHFGLASLVMNGSGNQYIYATSTGVDQGDLPFNLVINNSGGRVYLVGTINLPITGGGGWSDLSNNVVAGTSTVVFDAGNSGAYACFESGYPAVANLIGNTNFNQLEIYGDSCGRFYNDGSLSDKLTIGATSTPTVNGIFIISANSTSTSAIPTINGGTIDINGSIQANAPGSSITVGGGGTATIAITGSSTQSFTNQLGTYWQLPQFLINKPEVVLATVPRSSSEYPVQQGAAALLGYGNFLLGSTTIQQGEFWLPSSTSSASTSLSLAGNINIASAGALRIFQPSSTISNATSSNITITNNGLVHIDAPNSGCGLTATVTLSGGSSNNIVWAGSGKNIIRYVLASYQSTAGSITAINSTNSGNNTNWTFTSGQSPPQLVQAATQFVDYYNNSITAVPSWGVRPGDTVVVAIVTDGGAASAPTDNAGNTYYLVTSTPYSYYNFYLYYAKNVSTTPPFAVSASFPNSGADIEMLDYTGITPSSTLEAYNAAVAPGGATTTYSGYVNTSFPDDLYVVAGGGGDNQVQGFTVSSPFTQEAQLVSDGLTYTSPSLFMADYIASSTQYLQAGVTQADAAIIAAFRGAIVENYPPLGTLDSATFDTRGPSQLNSLMWRGTTPAGTSVNFQIAVSNSSNGPWNYIGPDGTGNTSFSGYPGTPIPFQACSLLSSCYSLFYNYQYFRYRVNLLSNGVNTPTVTGVVVNWSP